MKIVFVYPRFEKFLKNNTDLDTGLIEYFLGDFTTPPSLGIPILASLTPPEHEIVLVDDNNGDHVDFDIDADLIAINCFTPQATRALELGAQYKLHGKKVIIGGFFPSFMYEECLKYVDSVNIGEGEPTWLTILEDVKKGELKRIYKGGCSFDLSKMKIPRRDIFYSKKSYDWDEDLVQLTRGCVYNCAMCAIPAHMGSRMRFRPIDNVVEEVAQLKYENVYLADDTLFFPQKKVMEYARELFEKLTPLNKKYFVASTMALNIDKDFMKLIAKAGVRNFYCTMNVDPFSIKALAGEQKEQQMLCDLVKVLEDNDIRFFGSCAIGRDWDDESIADRVLELYHKANIHTAEFFLFTPYPGSVHWDRLTRQNRIIDYTWAHYNGAHVVTRPVNMTPEQLYGQFIKIWNEFFRMQKNQHAASLEPATWKDGKRSVGKPLERQGVKGQAVVTGIGLLSPIGNSAEEVIDSLKNSRSGIDTIKRFDASTFRTDKGGEIKNFDPSQYLSADEIALYEDRYYHYAITCARKALKQAGLEIGKNIDADKVALVLGTCNGGLLSAEEEYKWINGQSSRVFDEKMNLMAQYYGYGKALAHALGIKAEAWIVTTACSSTTGALGLVHSLIQSKRFSTVIVGGADTLCLANMSGFNGLKAVSTDRTAPFSMPVGLNIGEASCFWVVEEMEQALLREARCIGKIAGHATTCDAYHPTSPDPRGDGVFRTLTAALNDSGIAIEEIGCINAHGTGTEANDRAESKGMCKFIGEHAIPVVSSKSFFGHCMGTAGILEATCNLLAMNAGFIPPTINFSEPRVGCTLDYVPNIPREKSYEAFISANYAFGGNNAAVVITKWDYQLNSRPSKDERVVITGAGGIASTGLNLEKIGEKLQAGVHGISGVETLGLAPLTSKKAGLVPDFRDADIDRRIDMSGMNKLSRFATAAVHDALSDACLKVRPANAERVGIAMGICNGSSESEHMNSVFSTPDHAAHISCFSNITANSTAGWVANALSLKGINMTLSPGHHAGLQSLFYAYLMLREKRADAVIAAAGDEVYAQTYFNYDLIGYLKSGSKEDAYALDLEEPKKKVLGEGAAALLCETLSSAKERGVAVEAEIRGFGMSMDGDTFDKQCLGTDGIGRAITEAMQSANIDSSMVDLIVWAPQGNVQDLKIIDSSNKIFAGRMNTIPLLTTTFNTGYIESASLLLSVASLLRTLKTGKSIWPQKTGNAAIDSRKIDTTRYILIAGSSDVGYNYAAILDTAPEVN
ncbi:MAG TPA: beta-ketoacyl synthase N-terminal-like domain-containing protein [Chitinispirillaceae bacterium]|nr:beta-ketoacyl synthase N-terminal-like domain-containing protein [Chitinispirillaceae bacterium]